MQAVLMRETGAPDVLHLEEADQPDVGELVTALERADPELEIEVHEGGQPHYPLLVSAE